MKPHEIEMESFRIIDRETGAHNFSPEQWQVVRRMIHTSADFDYLQTVRFHPKAIPAGIEALRASANRPVPPICLKAVRIPCAVQLTAQAAVSSESIGWSAKSTS